MALLKKALIFFGVVWILCRRSVSWCVERCGTLNMIFLTTLPWKHVFFVRKKNLSNKTSTHLINQTKIKQGVTNNLTGLGWVGIDCAANIYLLRLGKFSPAFWPKDVKHTKKKTWKPAEFYGHPEWYINNRLHQAGPWFFHGIADSKLFFCRRFVTCFIMLVSDSPK